jgi:hypothetical protein
MNEQQRLREDKDGTANWKSWGPYVSERQWGTVREDYSENGDAWRYVTHDMSRSKAHRWGEEGIAGICDKQQTICFALGMWNTKDPIIKERFFGLTNGEGNHGEDVKELYYYLDNTPTHSYMKMLYKYPQEEFPYARLVQENNRRGRNDPEFELIDTGIFNEDKYFDVFVEYAKADANDILIRITVHNRGSESASLQLLPTIWFRNTWSWGYDNYKPSMMSSNDGNILLSHKKTGELTLYVENKPQLLFCENETNNTRLYGSPFKAGYYKDGINDYVVHGKKASVNILQKGTRAAVNYDLKLAPGASQVIRLRLGPKDMVDPFDQFDALFGLRQQEADRFYKTLQKDITSEDARSVQRQALAGMLWSKQFFYYDVSQWLNGDPGMPPPPEQRKKGRNCEWVHLNNEDIISMPDKWEYPWYAAWDLAFHCLPLAVIDPDFAKHQLGLLTKEWYMHPNGELPAYEWSFSDVNPPVHAWATWRVYKIDQKRNNGVGDTAFLESVFHKLLLNFTWWVNRKDTNGNNIFQGGFLGLDNIGVFDRSAKLADGSFIEQADGTSWMAMFSLNMLRIALELSLSNPVYQDMATKFFEHFLYIADAIANMGEGQGGLWDDEEKFYFDVLNKTDHVSVKLKIFSMVGLIPLFAVEVLDHNLLIEVPEFNHRLKWFLRYRPRLASLVSRWQEKSTKEKHLLSLLRGHRMKKILSRMLDESGFFSRYGIRSLSKCHKENPYELMVDGKQLSVGYTAGESTSGLFGGNSNWRGPVWMPVNYLLVESLQRFHHYYGDDFKIECPTGSGVFLTLLQIAEELTRRLSSLFLKDEDGKRPVFGDYTKMQLDPHFRDHLLFYEYFHGETGKGLGASHQTGWTGLIAKLLIPVKKRP